jgi:hypothetical protein
MILEWKRRRTSKILALMLVPGVRIPVKQAGRTGEQSLGFLHDQDGKRIYFAKSRALVEMPESAIVSCDLFQ